MKHEYVFVLDVTAVARTSIIVSAADEEIARRIAIDRANSGRPVFDIRIIDIEKTEVVRVFQTS